MIVSTQITDIEISSFVTILVLSINRKNNRNYGLSFKKIANFTGKLLQNYK